jgi:hypothetical protein
MGRGGGHMLGGPLQMAGWQGAADGWLGGKALQMARRVGKALQMARLVGKALQMARRVGKALQMARLVACPGRWPAVGQGAADGRAGERVAADGSDVTASSRRSRWGSAPNPAVGAPTPTAGNPTTAHGARFRRVPRRLVFLGRHFTALYGMGGSSATATPWKRAVVGRRPRSSLNAITAFFAPTFEASTPDVGGRDHYVSALSVSRVLNVNRPKGDTASDATWSREPCVSYTHFLHELFVCEVWTSCPWSPRATP